MANVSHFTEYSFLKIFRIKGSSILLILTASMFMLTCKQKLPNEFQSDGKTYVIDTTLVAPDSISVIQAGDIKLDSDLRTFAMNYSAALESDSSMNFAFSTVRPDPIVKIPEEFLACLPTAPTRIQDLKDGVILDAYEFKRGDEAKLGFLGFLNVEIADDEKITVVEFSQTGSQVCNGNQLKYGIGARMMMRVRSKKRSAKLNTPQQITASVIFGKAEVTYSLKTFGVSGPGVGNLVKLGTLTENTYQEFMQGISDLIVDAYNNNSAFVINPQPLFLNQN
ncbi:hypothetical protein [Chryseolinea sp. H1M3-3]|uniref:hypothetical protein n=1 Tax=Chryseolinea sp. H1M3-3 TaxID=3034144 RepID=UPI0023EC872F|nr:hypothetical protein [Chryseolinea sp. H1M3-3]